MDMESQVVSHELAVKLRDYGVEQDSAWYWVDVFPDDHKVGLRRITKENRWQYQLLDGYIVTGGDPISAFTVAELGVLLPESFTDNSAGHLPHINKADGFWQIDYPPKGRVFDQFEKEADARAALLMFEIMRS